LSRVAARHLSMLPRDANWKARRAKEANVETYYMTAPTDAEDESMKVHLAAEQEVADQKARGKVISYFEAIRRLELTRREERQREITPDRSTSGRPPC